MKSILILFLFILNLNATVLFLGNSHKKFKCDGEIYSPIKLIDCKNIEAINKINFCYFKNANLGCKSLNKNEKFNISKTDNNPINFKRLISFNKVEQISFGIKRFGDKSLKVNILPKGTILKPKSNLILHINSKSNNNIFSLYTNNKLIFTSSLKNNQIVIPKQKFKYSYSYKWNLKIADTIYRGSFDILDKSTQKDINKEISSITNKINNIEIKNQIISILYDQYGLKYDRYKILKGE
ncbi:hypothetical protein [Arcobacter sp. CECT 8985]|uniref:hypothetical protein n=1 Tax=Arcobacter sp. CECT 8985 TaxID=1935424 RepID=UPI00100B2BB2|nr:hypothetical protein [Arcobacter sp. CECT 8985]RXJ86059.1 hypothetical protein CRU93_10385 [Arcobacter sp. CECT 8985]